MYDIVLANNISMMGKYILFGVISFLVIIIGMLFYPTVHSMVSGVVQWDGITALEEAGMVLLAYGFIFFMIYIVYAHVWK